MFSWKTTTKMTTEHTIHILEIYKGKPIVIKAYDDIFGDYELTFAKWYHEVKNDQILVVSDFGVNAFDFGTIRNIRLLVSEEERIERINNATTMKEAWEYGKDDLTPNIEEALSQAQERLKPTADSQNKQLKDLIAFEIRHRHATLTVASVLRHLCINTLGTPKIEQTLARNDFVALCDKIEETIKKLNDIPF
jgi:hypothetical protein